MSSNTSMSRGLPLKMPQCKTRHCPPKKKKRPQFNFSFNFIFSFLFKLTESCSSVQSTSVDMLHNFFDVSLQSSRVNVTRRPR